MWSRSDGSPDALDSTFGSATASFNPNAAEGDSGHACSRTRASRNRQRGVSQCGIAQVLK
jgi:hypothetical protein